MPMAAITVSTLSDERLHLPPGVFFIGVVFYPIRQYVPMHVPATTRQVALLWFSSLDRRQTQVI